MKTIFDHLRECAGNGDMPTLDAEDARRVVETYDELLEALELTGGLWLHSAYGKVCSAAIKRATEARP